MKSRTLLFIPTYNCATQIKRVIESLTPEIQRRFSEILIVDNGSSDRTLETIQESIPYLKHTSYKVIQNKENYNLGGSHKIAFDYCINGLFDFCVVLHGDDQANIADLEQAFSTLDHNDCILGSRFMPQSTLIGYSRHRILGNLGFNLLFSIITRRKIYDLGSGLNGYRTEYLKKCPYHGFPNELTFNIYMLLHACVSRAKIIFFPISWRELDQISNARLWRMTKLITKIAIEFIFNAKKFNPPRSNHSRHRYRIIAERAET